MFPQAEPSRNFLRDRGFDGLTPASGNLSRWARIRTTQKPYSNPLTCLQISA
jgi:hypothetical protein